MQRLVRAMPAAGATPPSFPPGAVRVEAPRREGEFELPAAGRLGLAGGSRPSPCHMLHRGHHDVTDAGVSHQSGQCIGWYGQQMESLSAAVDRGGSEPFRSRQFLILHA